MNQAIKNNVPNAFTHSKDGKSLPKSFAYVAKTITPCAIRTAKATEFAKGSHITIGTQKDTDKRRAMSKAAI